MQKMMRFRLRSLAAVLLSSASIAAPAPYEGTIISMQSVECGTKHEGKDKSTQLLCQQYLIRTPTTEYQVRQPKPSEQAILPANTPIEFTLDKNKMKFKLNGKNYEFVIVGTAATKSQ